MATDVQQHRRHSDYQPLATAFPLVSPQAEMFQHFTLFFRLPKLEVEFDKYHLAKSRRTMRIAISVSILLWFLFLLGDQLVWKQYAASRGKNLVLRIATIVPSVIGLVLALKVPQVYNSPRWMQALLSFLAILGGEAILLSKEFNADYSPSPAIIVLMMGVFALSRAKFTWSTLICGVMAASFQLWLIASPVSSRLKFINAFPIWAGAGIAILNGYISERNLRQGFLESAIIAHEGEVLRQEEVKTQILLSNILPASISQRLLCEPSNVISDRYEECTILFADIVGFTTISERTDAHALVGFLNLVFSAFDEAIVTLAQQHRYLEKIKTIGDAYMVVAGVPTPSPDSCLWMADFALFILEKVKDVRTPNNGECDMRVGMHVGPVTAGVIGRQKFFYDLWGDAVNVASRMESTGRPGMIQTTSAVYSRLSKSYLFEERGQVDVKGKGSLNTYFLLGARTEPLAGNNHHDLVLEATSVSTSPENTESWALKPSSVLGDTLGREPSVLPPSPSPCAVQPALMARSVMAHNAFNADAVSEVELATSFRQASALPELPSPTHAAVRNINVLGASVPSVPPAESTEKKATDADAAEAERLLRTANPFTLAFREEAAEADFQQQRAVRSVRLFRNSTLCVLALEVVLAVIDVVTFPPSIRVCWAIRFGAVCTSIIALFAVSFARAAVPAVHLLAALVMVALGLGEFVIILATAQPPYVGEKHYLRYTNVAACVKCAYVSVRVHLIMMLLNTFVQLRFIHVTPLGLLAILGYVVVGALDRRVRPDMASVLVFMVPAQLITMVIAYTAEGRLRQQFLNDWLVQRKKAKIQEQQEKSDRLLRNILPDHIIATLKAKAAPEVIAEQIGQATILFADIVGFTKLSSALAPEAIVSMLNRVFTMFDELAERHNVLKIKTIGDAYLCVAGPGLSLTRDPSTLDAAPAGSAPYAPAFISTRDIARVALGMQRAVASASTDPDRPLHVRIGMHSGPVVAGVIGIVKFCYDIWGDAVNVASRLESSGVPGRVQASDAVYTILRSTFAFSDPRDLAVKGKGERVRAWFLDAELPLTSPAI